MVPRWLGLEYVESVSLLGQVGLDAPKSSTGEGPRIGWSAILRGASPFSHQKWPLSLFYSEKNKWGTPNLFLQYRARLEPNCKPCCEYPLWLIHLPVCCFSPDHSLFLWEEERDVRPWHYQPWKWVTRGNACSFWEEGTLDIRDILTYINIVLYLILLRYSSVNNTVSIDGYFFKKLF